MIKKIVRGGFIEKSLFILIFFIVLLFLNYQSVFFLQPRSFHFIRQTDSLSFINYYLKTGLNFFDIGNLNLYNNSGKTACEFPIFYYLVALLSITGVKSYLLLKSIYLIIFFFTSIVLFSFLRKTFSFIESIAITLLLFSSTIILYYTLNYIPNYPALCFTLCALIYFLTYLETNNSKKLNISLCFFLLASLLKITFSIYPVGCFLYFLIQFLKTKDIKYKIIFSFLIVFLFLISWNLFMIYYNKINHADYYLTSIKPIWSTTYYEREEVFSFIFNYWIYKYYYQTTIHVFFIISIVSIFFYKKNIIKYLQLSIIFFFGVSSYFVLFFKNFRDHDYYFLEFVPFFLFFFINSYQSISNSVNSKVKMALSVGLFILSLLSINYGKLNLHRRYDKPFEQVSKIAYQLEFIENKIDSIEISENAKILVISDYTMNGSLYYLNRFGYTIGDTSDIRLPKYYLASDYILITDSSLIKPLCLKYKLQNQLLSHRGAELYKIKH